MRALWVAAIVVGAIAIVISFLLRPKSDKQGSPVLLLREGSCVYTRVVTEPCSGKCKNATMKVQMVSADPACPPKDEETVPCPGEDSPDCACSLDDLKQLLQERSVENYNFCSSPDGSPSVCDNGNGGDRCYLGCDGPFVVAGEGYATCLSDGSWELADGPLQFRCVLPTKTCPPLENDETAFYGGNCINAGPGDQCTLNCHSGYYPTNGNAKITATCQNDYTWDVPLSCKPQACGACVAT